MLYRKNLHVRVTAVMFSQRGQPVVNHQEVRAGKKISSVLPGLSFRWWWSIQLWMSLRQAEIQLETCVSEGGKERKSWVSSA